MKRLIADYPRGGTFMRVTYLMAVAFMAVFAARADNLSDEKQILKLEDDWVRAMNTKDRQLLDIIIAPSSPATLLQRVSRSTPFVRQKQ
jgi:hypothetical protein